MEGTPRKTGFDPPYGTHQLISWVVMAIDVVLTSVVLIPSTQYPEWATLACVYSVSVVLTIALAYSATACNPTDPVVAAYSATATSSQTLEVSGKHAYFSLCTSIVSRTSKHCTVCNRCVERFDHHCKWLNNCVASVNYRTFVALIIAFEIVQGLQGGLSISLIVKYATDRDSLSHHLEGTYGYSKTADVFFWLFILGLVTAAPVIAVNSHLIVLHLMLKFRGITTYEYIISKRIKKGVKPVTPLDLEAVKTNPEPADVYVNFVGHDRIKSHVTGDNRSNSG